MKVNNCSKHNKARKKMLDYFSEKKVDHQYMDKFAVFDPEVVLLWGLC